MLREACLCFTRSHVRALIAETQRFDGCLLVFGCERHVAPLRKPKGPTGVSSGDAALAHSPRPGSGYLSRTGSRNPSHTLFPPLPAARLSIPLAALHPDPLRHGCAGGHYCGTPCPNTGGYQGWRGFLICKLTPLPLLSFFLSFGYLI